MLNTIESDVTLNSTVLGTIPGAGVLPYQTLSPVRRTFVFLDSRCTQPLTPRNAHALRYEFSKGRIGQRGKLKKQKKANPRKKDTKLKYDIKSILRAV